MRQGPPRKRLMQRTSEEKQNSPEPKRITLQERARKKMEYLQNLSKPFVPYGNISDLKNLGDLEKKKKG